MESEIKFPADVFLSYVDVAGKRVLDVGCGAGALVRQLRTLGADITGVECGDANRSAAMEADPDHADEYVNAGGEDLPFADDSADVVIYSLSLHHVPTELREQAISEAARVLRSGGTLFILEPLSEGPGQLVFEPIIDETVVCQEVQDLLGTLGTRGFSAIDSGHFIASSVYANFEAAVADVIGTDPDRQAALDANSDEMRTLFDSLGVPDRGGVSILQPMKFDSFTRA